MSTNKTENLGLHSWVESDPVLMREFNENFNALDAAIKKCENELDSATATINKTLNTAINNLESDLDEVVASGVKIHTGSYVGENKMEKTLYFPDTPKLVIVRGVNSTTTYQPLTLITPAIESTSQTESNTSYIMNVAWANKAVSWSCSTYGADSASTLNQANTNYLYIAFCI